MDAHENDHPTTDNGASKRTKAARRDAAAARQAAADRLAAAQTISQSVEDYHAASDREDAAKAELAAAGNDRHNAIRKMREAGLTINEIAELTGLSSSRVQTLTKSS